MEILWKVDPGIQDSKGEGAEMFKEQDAFGWQQVVEAEKQKLLIGPYWIGEWKILA